MATGSGLTVPILGVHASPPPYGLLKSLPGEYVYDQGALPVSPHNEDEAFPGSPLPAESRVADFNAPAFNALLNSDFVVNEGRWEGGFKWEPEKGALNLAASGDFPYWWDCPGATGATAAATVTGGKKPVIRPLAMREYRPYVAHAADSATTIGSEARDRAARAARILESNLSRIIEFEFWTGTAATAANFPNDFLTNAPTQLNGGATTGFARALAELEQALANSENGPTGVIHAQPRVVALWAARQLLFPVPGTGRLVTRLGNIVVAGQGYPGTGPGTVSVASTDAASWAYGTDMPRVAMSRMRGVPAGGNGPGQVDAAAMDFTVDDAIYRAERTVAAFFDATVKVGVKVNLTSEL